MILYSENTLRPEKNILELKVDGAGYIYVGLNLYKQAIVLADRFERNYQTLLERVGFDNEQEDACHFFGRNAPEPINILAPFLNLARGVEIGEDYSDITNTINGISKVINLEKFTKVPAAVRADVVVSDIDFNQIEEDRQAYITEHGAVAYSAEDIKLNRVYEILESFTSKLSKSISESLAHLVVHVDSQPVNINVNGGGISSGIPTSTASASTGSREEEIDNLFNTDPFAAFNMMMDDFDTDESSLSDGAKAEREEIRNEGEYVEKYTPAGKSYPVYNSPTIEQDIEPEPGSEPEPEPEPEPKPEIKIETPEEAFLKMLG